MKEGWKRDLAAAAVIIGTYGALFLLGITCPIKFLTGVSCPGCGMTRAWLALLRLDFFSALAFHPLFWLPPLALGMYLFQDRLPRAVVRYAPAVVCGAFFAVYFIRLLGGLAPEIVVCSPAEGLFCRLGAELLHIL